VARRTIDYVQRHCVVWPPLVDLRTRFEAKYGKQNWAHPDLADWLDPAGGVDIPPTEEPSNGGASTKPDGIFD
jgi:hypothetical protein